MCYRVCSCIKLMCKYAYLLWCLNRLLQERAPKKRKTKCKARLNVHVMLLFYIELCSLENLIGTIQPCYCITSTSFTCFLLTAPEFIP